MRKIKWSLSFVLVFCLAFFMLSANALATTIESGSCGSNLTWILDSNGTLSISGSGPMPDYDNYTSVPW